MASASSFVLRIIGAKHEKRQMFGVAKYFNFLIQFASTFVNRNNCEVVWVFNFGFCDLWPMAATEDPGASQVQQRTRQ